MTAVEWLIEELTKNGHNFKLYKKEINQAKELEKQQILEAYIEGAGGSVYAYSEFSEQYYNETFNK